MTATPIPNRLARLDTLTLASGSHDSLEQGACVMEIVAWVAGEEWSDHPACASPVIAAFLRSRSGYSHHLRHPARSYVESRDWHSPHRPSGGGEVMAAPFDHDADFAAGDPRDFRIVDPDDWDVAPPEDWWLVCPPPVEPMPWRWAVPLGLVCAAWVYGLLLAAGWAIHTVEGWLR